MWNSFQSLFGGRVPDNKADFFKEQATKYRIPILNGSSRRDNPSLICKVPLWEHQKAMLARCKQIEANPRNATPVLVNEDRYGFDKEGNRLKPKVVPVPVGVMNDPPGCGKTYALLALLAESKSLNVIVVPQNIFFQWKESILAMYPDRSQMKVKFINDYSDIMNVYRMSVGFSNPLDGIQIVLLNDVFAEMFAQGIVDNKIPVERLIIDEIDSVQNRLLTPIPSKHVWLISASFIVKENVAVGPYKIETSDVPFVFCRCDPQFIERSINLEPPTVEKLVCDDAEIQLFRDIATDASVAALHAGDVRTLLKEMNKTFPPDQHSLKELAEMYVKDNLRLEEDKKTAEKNLREQKQAYEEEGNADTRRLIMNRIQDYSSQVNDLTRRINKRIVMEGKLKNFVPPTPEKTKWAMYEKEICARILKDPSKKWIICNDNASAVNKAMELLEKAGAKCKMLDGGSAPVIQKTIQAYKGLCPERGDEVQVLFLNSKLEAVGMNLENTGVLLFMHSTKQEMVQQVIGRAQRFGRKGRLHVIALFNNQENAEL